MAPKQPTPSRAELLSRMIDAVNDDDPAALGALSTRAARRPSTSATKIHIEAKTAYGETPLVVASIYAPRVAELLLDRGARPDVPDKWGNTAARRAAEGGFKGPPRGDPSRAKLVARLKEAEAKAKARLRDDWDGRREAADALRARGNAEFRRGNPARALELYRESLEHMQDARVFNNMAAARLQIMLAEERSAGSMTRKAYEGFFRAVNDAGKASRMDPTSVKAWYRMARGYMGYGDFLRALAHLKDGLEHCPGDPELTKLAAELKDLGVKDGISNPLSPAAPRLRALLDAGARSSPCAWCQGPLAEPLAQWEGCCPYCAMDPPDKVDRARLDGLRLGKAC
ncbi:hypothetical protein DFJ74DRAFT_713096 [Hyaloraphidium curvatum]|nr:hypothetical protein DFJ74DRAFT_713096 [Hyaloraphidium curvatum]